MCDCGCNTCETKKAVMLNESIAPKEILSEGLKYHMDNNMPLTEHVYRAGSQKYFDLWAEARALYSRNILDVDGDDLEVLTETDLGHYGMFEGKKVPLDFPIEITEAELNDFPFEYKGFKYNVESTEGMVNDRGQKVWQVSIQDREGDVETTTVRGSSDREGHQEAKDFIDDELLPYYGLDEDLDKKPNFADFEYRVALLFKPGEKTEEEIRNYARVPFRKAIDAWEAGRPWKHFLPKTLSDFTNMWNSSFNVNEAKILKNGDPYFIIQSLKTGSPKYIASIEGEKPLWVPDSRIEQAYKFATLKDAKNYLSKFNPKITTSWHIYRRPYDLSPKDIGFGRDLKNINENRIIIKTKGKRLAIDKKDLQRLKSGKDIVGYSTKYPGQEEWVLARDKWEIEGPLKESKKKAKKNTKKLNKPMRDSSGGKAYKVYVKDPKTGNIKTVRFGSGGLRAKINDKKARNAFAKRHKCSQKKDKTKASYWSCRLPRYAKLLGLKSNFGGFW